MYLLNSRLFYEGRQKLMVSSCSETLLTFKEIKIYCSVNNSDTGF
jgi:hypothetical protein